MKLIIDIPDEAYRARQHWVANPKRIIDEVDTAIAHGTPYNPSGDLISRSALKETINSSIAEATEVGIVVNADYLWKLLDYAIDNALTVDIKDQIAGAYNEGYMCGSKEAEKARPQGEYVDISKLRLMTVEECAGHTIDYAMGWKACIEWIKKGGAE